MSAYGAALPTLFTQGLVITLYVSICAMVLALGGGFLIGTLRSQRLPILDPLLQAYVEVFRGIPLLVLMFFTFFGLPQLGIRTQDNVAAIIALGLWGAANAAEIVRGAIASIPKGQREAASALGLDGLTIMLTVILPQALRRMVPPFMSLFTAVVESSSLAALIGVKDLLESVRVKVETNSELWFPLLLTALIVYFAVNYPISLLSQRLEKRLA